MPARIESAVAGDLESIRVLLHGVSLPTEGLREHLTTALIAREGDAVVGCVALEVYGDAALLRSLAVMPSRQSGGLGRRLVSAALDLGRERGVTTFSLLTTTAPDFFARHFGFTAVARDAVPPAVRGSVEFESACPATAKAMILVQPRCPILPL
jgi:amino-acid N-acetyltransferase